MSGTHSRSTSRSSRVPASVVLYYVLCALAISGCMVALVWYQVVFRAATSVTAHEAVSSSSTIASATTTGTSAIDEVRAEFYERYGGREAATEMLKRGVQTFGKVRNTAVRMLEAAAAGEPFVLSFAGYSVTVGRGNHLHQSYPFVIERVLKPVLQQALGLDITVRNAAIGGIPSYPYGFCFEHFLGLDSDVISWDYSMNEGKGAAVLESYIRQSQSQLPHKPMLILLDTNQQRCNLVKDYANSGNNV